MKKWRKYLIIINIEMKQKNIIKNRIISRVKIREEQIEKLSKLLISDSIYLVVALENAEFIPDLFTFDINSLNQN
ncbi:MAG: hypothetical protein IPM32_07860 [Ignavibacteriae bacterium]|nr:hypothetical protein [Ignavibacteriota bacterium]